MGQPGIFRHVEHHEGGDSVPSVGRLHRVVIDVDGSWVPCLGELDHLIAVDGEWRARRDVGECGPRAGLPRLESVGLQLTHGDCGCVAAGLVGRGREIGELRVTDAVGVDIDGGCIAS